MKYFLGISLFVVFLFVSVLVGFWAWLPNEQEIKGCLITSMYKVELCPQSKNYVPLKRISPYLKKAIVLTEDSSFYQHQGFDWVAIERNAREGFESGNFKRGGSTITQQLAKNMFFSSDRSFIRKGLEALVTWRIEKYLSKDEIYERYLNVIEFGKDIYGVKQAAQFYFGKQPSELDVVESSFLAMVLPNPKKYSQSYFKKDLTPFARKRMEKILNDMFKYSRISVDEYDIAMVQIGYFFRSHPVQDEMAEIMTDQEVLEIEKELEELNLEAPTEPAPAPTPAQSNLLQEPHTDSLEGDIHQNPGDDQHNQYMDQNQ